MTTWLVTRHAGAEEWARQTGIYPDDGCVVASLDMGQVRPGDLIVGTLPINLAARVIELGARYLHLSLEVPAEARGQELSAAQMRTYGAKLEEYRVQKAMDFPSAAHLSEYDRPVVMLAIASEQALPNLLPLLAWPREKGRVIGMHLICSTSPRITSAVTNVKQICSLINLPVLTHEHMPDGPLADITAYAANVVNTIRQQHPTALLVLNATGGTKPMAFAMLHVLGPQGHAIYCDTERERIEYLQPASFPAISLPPEGLSVEIILMAHGIKFGKTQSTQPSWLEKARQRQASTHYLRKEAKKGKPAEWFFSSLQAILTKALPPKGPFKNTVLCSEVKNIQKNFKHLCAKLERDGLIHVTEEAYEFPNEDAALYLQGGWLEEMLALCVDDICRKHSIAGEHWRAGMEVTTLTATSDKPLNEIDMAIAYRNRLLIIECKSGAGIGKDDMAAVTKLEAMANHVGGRLAEKWLLCSRQIYDGSMIRTRCAEYRIPLLEYDVLAPNVLEAKIEAWLGVGADSAVEVST